MSISNIALFTHYYLLIILIAGRVLTFILLSDRNYLLLFSQIHLKYLYISSIIAHNFHAKFILEIHFHVHMRSFCALEMEMLSIEKTLPTGILDPRFF